MALPPTIPTSFVPKQPVATQARRKRAPLGIFYYGALFLLGVAVVGAGLTFGYKTYLDSVRDARKTRLSAAEQNINPEAVEDFIRLRNRIQASNTLLNQHVVLSRFFDVVESITLKNVRFQSLTASVGNDRTTKIEMRGLARSFNALAAESAAFAADKRIKRAIFSNITVNESGVVSFALKAEIDSKLITVSGDPRVQVAAPTPNVVAPEVFEEVPATPSASTTTP